MLASTKFLGTFRLSLRLLAEANPSPQSSPPPYSSSHSPPSRCSPRDPSSPKPGICARCDPNPPHLDISQIPSRTCHTTPPAPSVPIVPRFLRVPGPVIIPYSSSSASREPHPVPYCTFLVHPSPFLLPYSAFGTRKSFHLASNLIVYATKNADTAHAAHCPKAEPRYALPKKRFYHPCPLLSPYRIHRKPHPCSDRV